MWLDTAKDWVAFLGGVIGGITGPAALYLSIKNYQRDRADIQVTLMRHMVMGDAIGGRLLPPESTLYAVIKVTNRGRREILIEKCGLFFYSPGLAFVLDDQGQNRVLSESNPSTMFLVKESSIDWAKVWFAAVWDGAGREYRYYPDAFWARERKLWPHRREWRKAGSLRPKRWIPG